MPTGFWLNKARMNQEWLGKSENKSKLKIKLKNANWNMWLLLLRKGMADTVFFKFCNGWHLFFGEVVMFKPYRSLKESGGYQCL